MKKEWKEIIKKCFGKEKDDRYHAIAMLFIYGIFILILIIMIRMGGSGIGNSIPEKDSMVPTPSVIPTPSPSPGESIIIPNISDINYSYSYTITYNGVSEVYLGKKIDEKEKFTLIRNGVTTDYAILNDNYLVLENGVYHITENPSKFFKYCDVEKVLQLIENKTPIELEEMTQYVLSNQELSSIYQDNMYINNNQDNKIKLSFSHQVLKKIELDFRNYLTSIEGNPVDFTVRMEFADIGTTENFEIKIS